MSLHYLVKYLCSKNRNAEEVIEAFYRVRLSHSKNSLKISVWKNILFLNSVTKRRSHWSYKKSHYRLYTTAVTKKEMLQQNAIHDQQSVSYWRSQSVIKSKLVKSSYIFLDNKLTLILWDYCGTCLLTQQQSPTVFVLYTQVILLAWRVLHLWGQTSKANWVYDAINHFASNVAKCSPILKILSPANWISNVVTHRNLNACLYYLIIYH